MPGWSDVGKDGAPPVRGAASFKIANNDNMHARAAGRIAQERRILDDAPRI